MTSPVATDQPGRPARSRIVGATTALLLVAVAGCGGPNGLEGKVVAVDDTGKQVRALGGGWVAVLGDAGLRTFLGDAGIDTPTSADLPFLDGRVRRDDVTSAGGTLATIDQDGAFALRGTGRQTVCRLVEAPQVDLLRGCAVVDLPAQGRLQLSVGKGGLNARLSR